jgi:protein involved in polysaccharide export with SLBB domain
MTAYPRSLKLFAIGLLLAVQGVYGQDKSMFGGSDELEALARMKTPAISSPQEGAALESTVDPTRYYVGPSDVIAVNIWVSPPLNFTLTVTPEGTLIIPTVGEVIVSDLLLSDAKAKILDAIRKKYLTAQSSVTLLKPRPIIVSVLGTVLHPGLYTLTSVARANKAIEEANRPTQKEYASDAARFQDEMSTRSIVLKRKDGTQQRVDIARFFATREEIWNPYLREGDVLIVPRKNMAKNVFGIYGEVNAPGRYEYVQGDSVLDALRMGQGFTRLAIGDSVEFSRLNVDGTSLTTTVINLRAIRDRVEPNLAIEPGDRLIVKGKIDLREDYRISVQGEVLHPGIYPITKNRTKLSDVIRQSGGFTEFAWLEDAELNRRSVGADEIALERLVSLRGGASQEDSAYYLLETDLRLRKEIVNVDFDGLFVHGDSTQDVIVQSDDYIYVPSRKKTIYVFGQVVTSGHVPFMPGEGVDYYIRKAGGFTDRAREGDLKIVKAKTRQWLSPKETQIEEGDYVWVPKVVERPFSYWMNIIGQTAAVVSVGVSIVLLVIQSKK